MLKLDCSLINFIRAAALAFASCNLKRNLSRTEVVSMKGSKKWYDISNFFTLIKFYLHIYSSFYVPTQLSWNGLQDRLWKNSVISFPSFFSLVPTVSLSIKFSLCGDLKSSVTVSSKNYWCYLKREQTKNYSLVRTVSFFICKLLQFRQDSWKIRLFQTSLW